MATSGAASKIVAAIRFAIATCRSIRWRSSCLDRSGNDRSARRASTPRWRASTTSASAASSGSRSTRSAASVAELVFEPGGDQPFVDTGLQIRHDTNLENGTDRCGQAVAVTWYSVRCILQIDDAYEERITLWSAASFDEAIELAEAEADEYVLTLEGVRLGLAHAFHLFDTPGSGAEIFSHWRGPATSNPRPTFRRTSTPEASGNSATTRAMLDERRHRDIEVPLPPGNDPAPLDVDSGRVTSRDRSAREAPDVVAVLDVGSVAKGSVGWCHRHHESETTGRDLDALADLISANLTDRLRVALGFEAPLFVALPARATDLCKARDGEGRSAWAAAGGLGALGVATQQTTYVLARIANAAAHVSVGLGVDDLWNPSSNLVIWEAFVTGRAKDRASTDPHVSDARAAVVELVQRIATGAVASDVVVDGPSFSLVGAARLRSGLSTDLDLLADALSRGATAGPRRMVATPITSAGATPPDASGLARSPRWRPVRSARIRRISSRLRNRVLLEGVAGAAGEDEVPVVVGAVALAEDFAAVGFGVLVADVLVDDVGGVGDEVVRRPTVVRRCRFLRSGACSAVRTRRSASSRSGSSPQQKAGP